MCMASWFIRKSPTSLHLSMRLQSQSRVSVFFPTAGHAAGDAFMALSIHTPRVLFVQDLAAQQTTTAYQTFVETPPQVSTRPFMRTMAMRLHTVRVDEQDA